MSDEMMPAPFIVGVGRSGTTLLRLMLDAHPQLAIPPETHFLPELIACFEGGRSPLPSELVEAVQTHPGWRDFGLTEAQLTAAFSPPDGASRSASGRNSPPGETGGNRPTHPPLAPSAGRMGLGGVGGAVESFYDAYAARHGKARWGDKTPVYIESIALIGAALGDRARFVHLIRDGRDVALSRRSRASRRGREPTPAAKEAETWLRRIEGARGQGARVAHYEEIRYEDLVADPEAVLRRICDLIELAFDPAMLDYHEGAAARLAELSDLPGKGGKVRPGSERIAAHALTTEPPRSDRAGRWQTELDAASIAEYESVAGGLLSELGYPLSAR